MREWDARRLAAQAGARLIAGAEPTGERERRGGSGRGSAPGPLGVSIDSRALAAGELFVGLAGEHVDGGRYAAQALRAGAWGVLVAPGHASAALAAARERELEATGADRTPAASAAPEGMAAVLVHEDPLRALQSLAGAWRRELRARGARLVAITGSTGKTSTKDILAALLSGAGLRVAASPENHNTEIGLPLALLSAPGETQALVLEMAMRGPGQIAELTAIAEPDVGVIVNVGPAHLERLGSLEAVAAAKAELIAGLATGATVVVPADEPLLAGHLRAELRTITFGEGGEVRLAGRGQDGRVAIDHAGRLIELRPSFAQAHQLRNLLAAVAAARALGITPRGRLQVRFTAMRGQRERLPGGIELIDDCYNANPMSMRAAIDELTASAAGRSVAVLGDMLELGTLAPRLHREIGAHARAAGVQLLVTVGPLAARMASSFAGETRAAGDAREAGELLDGLLREGDTVLVKGSRGLGLERVVERLRAAGAAQANTHASGERRGTEARAAFARPAAGASPGPGRR
ncbi:MAG TPA: UDP-N-acetylmuramoyl-tripeptide--D-alanyl-D-alanine ligase [Solirubrobacteraceae bacterium]|nr:UDP-N-acetylmuramoyl-tripeptide--D-alanyl-D-alanine ligase [Solirubrobacteraceae bacterium]